MAEDTQPVPNSDESATAAVQAESEKSREDVKSSDAPANTGNRRFLSKLVSASFYRINRYLKLIVSITLRTSIVVGLVIIIVYLYRELNDKSYHIQEFEVPEDLVAMGYNGKVIARALQYEVDRIVYLAGLTWSPKEMEEYNQSADKTQIQAEVAGVGISPETIIRYIKQVLGVPYRSISCDIVHDDNKLILVHRRKINCTYHRNYVT